jgi:hypothetical protein
MDEYAQLTARLLTSRILQQMARNSKKSWSVTAAGNSFCHNSAERAPITAGCEYIVLFAHKTQQLASFKG